LFFCFFCAIAMALVPSIMVANHCSSLTRAAVKVLPNAMDCATFVQCGSVTVVDLRLS
jgi:hypothetical protein